jgi:hypothetical protein
MPKSDLTIFDGEARYAGRTRVNRMVYEFTQADLIGQTAVTSASFGLNGEVHQIILDVSSSKLGTNGNTQTAQGTFSMISDIPTIAGGDITPFEPITSLDYTNKTGGRYYQFQTNEGAAMGTQEHALTVRPGLSGHDTPAAPKTPIVNGTQTVINKNQPWTGRVCGNYTLKLTSTSAWAADTGTIRVIIMYS